MVWKIIKYCVPLIASMIIATESSGNPTISNVVVASGTNYQVVTDGLIAGAAQYIDRTHTFTAIPVSLVGTTYIRTANDDKRQKVTPFLSFDVSVTVKVYVAFDDRVPTPEWLSQFFDTGEDIDGTDGQTFSLFMSYFQPGKVVLGGNVGSIPSCMYTVIIVPTGSLNHAPLVSAGSDQVIAFPANNIGLAGRVLSDGLPTDVITAVWSKGSGPGTVTFSDVNDLNVTATFAAAGIYMLKLTANDSALRSSDTVRIEVNPEPGPFDLARANGVLANEGWNRCRDFLRAWITKADPVTHLIPRTFTGDWYWDQKDAAADCYPFMVLTAQMTDPTNFNGRCLEMLNTEKSLTSRVGMIPDEWDFATQTFRYPSIDMARIQFGASEYIKDGLIPITEWIGVSPWSDRMVEIMDDQWTYASFPSPFGMLVSDSIETNGEMMQVLPRLYFMTGDEKYLDYACRLADYYLLGDNHPTRDFTTLHLSDHAVELISGLCETYIACSFARPKKRQEYYPYIHEILDRLLEIAVNEHGFFYRCVNPQTGEIFGSRLSDNWGYIYNGYYDVYIADGTETYRRAVISALGYLRDYYTGYTWFNNDMDSLADSIESALYMFNRERVFSVSEWLDTEMQRLWGYQEEAKGAIDRTYLDGNFARTTMLYCLWKTQGITITPWREDVQIGASRSGNEVRIVLRAETAWSGTLQFDSARHRTIMNLPVDWPRINQFGLEWTTVQPGSSYTVEYAGAGIRTRYTGDRLLKGLAVYVNAGEELQLLVTCPKK